MNGVAAPITDDRTRLIASHNEASNTYDKTLLTLASGALGLSIAFVKDIATHPTSKWLLLWAWVLLGASLTLIVFSHMASVEVHKRLIDGMDKKRRYSDEPWLVRHGVTWMNRLAGGAFIVGVVFLIAFAYVNFK